MTTNSPKKLFCFGYGYVAQHLARELKEQDPSWEICGTTTDKEKLAQMREDGIKAYLFSDKMPFNDPIFILKDVTHILISTPPQKDGDVVFKTHARDILQIPTVQWIGYLSSTNVYGNRDGDWVDETAEVRPTSERGTKRAKAETQWLKMRRIAGIPINIFRLSGIYGVGRSAISTVRAGNSKRVHKEGHAFNRIHVDDISQILIASMGHPEPGDIYNLADDNPAPSHELISYACELLGKTPLPLIQYDEDLSMAPMARSFYKENKRVSNKKIKEKLEISLLHPDYKSWLDDILEKNKQGIV
jgi:nucleoside-diphosphate-sugar epimerase